MRWPFTTRAPDPGRASERAIERQLRAIERQGAGMTWIAHVVSFALIVAFSAGSLVALAGEALSAFLAAWSHGRLDIPQLISFAVSLLLVICMDLAMIYAAAQVRMLHQRRQPGAWLHALVIVGVALVEAATYLYMSALYDRPTTWQVWLLLVARALSAPLTSVYLALARTLPIGARDILYQVELVTARGVIADMTQIASDSTATTERKLALYQASSVMSDEDRARLDQLIAAARSPSLTAIAAPVIEARQDDRQDDHSAEPPASEPPTPPDGDGPGGGNGSGDLASNPTPAAEPPTSAAATNVTSITTRRGVGAARRAPKRDRRTASRANARSGRRGSAEQRIRAAVAQDPLATPEQIATRARTSSSTVSKWLAVIEAERQAARTHRAAQ